jgi:hypothetical protein
MNISDWDGQGILNHEVELKALLSPEIEPQFYHFLYSYHYFIFNNVLDISSRSEGITPVSSANFCHWFTVSFISSMMADAFLHLIDSPITVKSFLMMLLRLLLMLNA